MKICRQLEKQIDVLKAYFNTDDEIVWQEQIFIKYQLAEKVYVEISSVRCFCSGH